MGFRQDINRLRAIAVIAVVLFHFKPEWLPGGFAGVDVFFVISGFLMTKIIFTELANKSFSIIHFYIARANRIIPALAALCLVLLVFGWSYLTPIDYRSLLIHVVSSLGFLSNIIYLNEAGYFDAASHDKWLLHTWSLSAEWQFYIIYPLILVGMNKIFSLKAMKQIILISTGVFFLLSALATYQWPNSAYYLFPTRAWEMMVGATAYLFPIAFQSNTKFKIEALGLALIMLSYVFITKDNLWPGYLAAIPTLGTFLTIQSQFNERRIPGDFVLQKLGNWSYSIYLWHWPLVVAIYYFSLAEEWRYIFMCMSIVLGVLSYNYIEKKRYKSQYISLSALLLIVSSSLVYLNNAYLYQFPWDIYRGMMPDSSSGRFTWAKHLTLNKRTDFSDQSKENLLIIGDSQAGDLINMLDTQGFLDRYNVVSRAVSSRCGAFYMPDSEAKHYYREHNDQLTGLNHEVTDDVCKKSISYLWNFDITKADYIFISFLWNEQGNTALEDEMVRLKARTNADITFFGIKSLAKSTPDIVFDYYKKHGYNKDDSNINESNSRNSNSRNLYYDKINVYAKKYVSGIFNEFNIEVMNKAYNHGFNYVDLFKITCGDQSCLALDREGNPIFYDRNHTTREGNVHMGRELLERFNLP